MDNQLFHRKKFTSETKNNQDSFSVLLVNKLDRLLYKNYNGRINWIPPVHNWKCVYALPYSWEVGFLPSGKTYFINHMQKTTTNIFPNELMYQPDLRFSQILSSIEESSASTLNKFETTIILDRSANNYGIRIEDFDIGQKPIIKNLNFDDSNFSFFRDGDQIISINGITYDNQETFLKLIYEINHPKTLNTMTILFQRAEMNLASKNDSHNIQHLEKLKSSFLSKDTISKRVRYPVKVHFADRPLYLLKPASIQNKKLLNSVDYYSSKIHVIFETGITHSLIFEANTTVEEYIRNVVIKHSFGSPDYFSLARYDKNNIIKEVYSHETWLKDVWNCKNSSPCYLIISHIPTNINLWRDISYRRISFYLFSQCLGNIKMRTGLPTQLNEDAIIKMAALVVIHEFLIGLQSSQQKRESIRKSFIGSIRRSIKEKKNLHSSSTSVDIQLEKNEKLFKIDLKKFLKEEYLNEFENWFTIFDSRRDLNKNDVAQTIYQFLYSIGESYLINDHKFSLTVKQIDDVVHKIQIDFLEIAIRCNIIGLYSFRVHDCTNDIRRIGVPVTLIISVTNGIGIENDSKFLSICIFSKIFSIVLSYNIDGRYLVSFVIDEERIFSFVTNRNTATTIVHLLIQQSSNEKIISIDDVDESNTNSIVLLNLTDINKRASLDSVPGYNDRNHVLPSFWNYSMKSLFEFYSSLKTYQSLNNKSNLNAFQSEILAIAEKNLIHKWTIETGFANIQSFIDLDDNLKKLNFKSLMFHSFNEDCYSTDSYNTPPTVIPTTSLVSRSIKEFSNTPNILPITSTLAVFTGIPELDSPIEENNVEEKSS